MAAPSPRVEWSASRLAAETHRRPESRHRQTRPAARPAVGCRAAHSRRAAGLISGCWCPSGVADLDDSLVRLLVDDHRDIAARCVLAGVRQALLRDAVRRLGQRARLRTRVPAPVTGHGQARLLRPGDQRHERRVISHQVFERTLRRYAVVPQALEQVPQPGDDTAAVGLDGLNRATCAFFAGTDGERPGLQHHQTHPVADGVVHVGGQPGAIPGASSAVARFRSRSARSARSVSESSSDRRACTHRPSGSAHTSSTRLVTGSRYGPVAPAAPPRARDLAPEPLGQKAFGAAWAAR